MFGTWAVSTWECCKGYHETWRSTRPLRFGHTIQWQPTCRFDSSRADVSSRVLWAVKMTLGGYHPDAETGRHQVNSNILYYADNIVFYTIGQRRQLAFQSFKNVERSWTCSAVTRWKYRVPSPLFSCMFDLSLSIFDLSNAIPKQTFPKHVNNTPRETVHGEAHLSRLFSCLCRWP